MTQRESTIYLNKDEGYFAHVRVDMLGLLPPGLDKVLEVGCGQGRSLKWLKENKDCKWTAGIEMFPEAAEKAKDHLDVLYEGNIETMDLPFKDNSLDAILCLDVLEHLVNPWLVISKLQPLLKSGGILLTSIPNVRNFRVLLPLLFQGKWEYKEAGGIMDKTHLRFFTKESAVQLIEQAGFVIELVKSNGLEPGTKARLVNLFTLCLFQPFFEIQYIIKAIKR